MPKGWKVKDLPMDGTVRSHHEVEAAGTLKLKRLRRRRKGKQEC